MKTYKGAQSDVVIRLLGADPEVFAQKQLNYNNGGKFDRGRFHRRCNAAIKVFLDWFAVGKCKEPCIVYLEPEIVKDVTECLVAVGLNATYNIRLMPFDMKVAYIKVQDNV